MARYFTYENKSLSGLIVCPDGQTERYQKYLDRYKESKATRVKYESALTEADLEMNLVIQGRLSQFRLDFLKDKPIPITIANEQVQIGEFEFPAAQTGFCAILLNPHNPEKYLYFKLRGDSVKSSYVENWVDYVFYRDGPDDQPEVLLHGFFDHATENWAFSNRLYYGSDAVKMFCKDGICPAPPEPTGGSLTGLPAGLSRKTPAIPVAASPDSRSWTLGQRNCRFPSILTGRDGTGYVAWEEEGDIFLAALGDNRTDTWTIERGPADSFTPVLAWSRETLWIFYLNDKDGIYRLYGQSLPDEELAEPVLISEVKPSDATAPATAWTPDGKIAVAWTDWKANQRYPVYRVIEDRFLGEIQPILIKKPEIKYTNAWCVSLAYDRSGALQGAWNQHYPLTLGVYAGTLTEEATEVHDKLGGYPSVVFDHHDRFWVFWQTSAWNSLKGAPQHIHGSYFDPDRKQWAMPYTLSHKDMTRFNETPRAAAAKDGTLWVVWSGRNKEKDPWQVYISAWQDEKWTTPRAVSSEAENARAPVIAIGSGDEIWAAWHSGRGENMKIKTVSLDTP